MYKAPEKVQYSGEADKAEATVTCNIASIHNSVIHNSSPLSDVLILAVCGLLAATRLNLVMTEEPVAAVVAVPAAGITVFGFGCRLISTGCSDVIGVVGVTEDQWGMIGDAFNTA